MFGLVGLSFNLSLLVISDSAKMTCLRDFERFKDALFLFCVLSFTFQGVSCELVVSPVGPSHVNALAGSNVTLSVSFSGAPDPVVTWFKEGLPVGTWTINSTSPPDIDENRKDVLRIEKNGSLTFVNVPLKFTSNYTVELTKSGLEKTFTTFSLHIFEYIQGVTLSIQPDFAKEGIDMFTLQYSMQQGVVEQQIWHFNDTKLTNSSHHLVVERSLVILKPNRGDTGRYAVVLMNPFSRATAHKNVTILYGPDEPIIEVHPAKSFYVAGDSLSLSCQAEGFPQPSAEWGFDGHILSDAHDGVLNLTDVQTSQGGVYTCMLLNELTEEKREKNVTVNIYEKPLGSPSCSVLSVNNLDLQYQCEWTGGTPQAQLSFPALNNTVRGAGKLRLTISASSDLNEKTVTCMADHPIEQSTCNITASSPVEFLPALRTSVDPDGKIAVTIQCVSEASPQAVVSWSKDSEAVASGAIYQISNDTTQMKIRGYNISSFIFHNYTCTCGNPLGSKRRHIQLQGPSISDSSLFPNQDRTIITLTWEVPPTSVVTGFDIQMKGPNLLNKNGNITLNKGSSQVYRTIRQKPGSARSIDIFMLDPKLTYRFRIIPKARFAEGEPSEIHRIGPGEGLSGPAIAGIAAGIPCSILALLLLCGLIYLIIYCKSSKSHQTRYPVARAVEKAKTVQPDITPHNRLTGGLKLSPDYNRLHQAPSERSVSLPTFVPPPPVRVATTV
ncbi:V-set and immunoglobulin domain-containing protein 10-like [Cololabis saira]|uniref:V-set and immunoglobulin domain-containing protein 10-like n=1 Tax=Cololabis saira TaxID=129043 RepID=UPI002AD5781D|nr:V-set and immunoglobulin domain-containing protein 10-like [Cololabis saira]